MPCIDAEPLCRDDTLITLSRKYPELQAQDHGDFVRLAPSDTGDGIVSIWCDYRDVSEARVQRNADRFRYTLSHTTRAYDYVGPYSHPTEEGCWIMARRYFIDAGVIAVPTDNSHLTSITKEYVDKAQAARGQNTLLPIVGDYIVDRDGVTRRLSNVIEDEKMQAAKALDHSYYLLSKGGGSFSGACGHVLPQSQLRGTETARRARFWMFKDNRSGAGRGVDVFIDVAVWKWSGRFEGTL